MVAAINDLYCGELRLWLNLYLPSVKLVKKVRVGAKVRRVYDAPQTPWQRVLASGPRNAARITELKGSCRWIRSSSGGKSTSSYSEFISWPIGA